jgi:hypothetical protein
MYLWNKFYEDAKPKKCRYEQNVQIVLFYEFVS